MLCLCNRCHDDEYQCYDGAGVGKDKHCNGQRSCAAFSDELKLCGSNITKS